MARALDSRGMRCHVGAVALSLCSDPLVQVGARHSHMGGAQHDVEAQVRPSAEGVSHHVGFAGHVLDFHVILLHQLQPAGLAAAEVRLRLQILQRVVVSVHNKMTPQQIVAPHLQRVHQCQIFLLMHWVARLSRRQFA